MKEKGFKKTAPEDMGYRYNGSGWQPVPEEEDEYTKRGAGVNASGDKKAYHKDDNKPTKK